jgi:head-tail adaptor
VTVWLLVLVCMAGDPACTQGERWFADVTYATQAECYIAGEKIAKRRVVVCLRGRRGDVT